MKLLISRSKLSGPTEFTLRYQKIEISRVEMQRKMGNGSKLSSLISVGILRYQWSRFRKFS